GYTIFGQAMERTGYARATLAVREGLQAPVPALDPGEWVTMNDMMGGMMGGMDHGGSGQAMEMTGMTGMTGMGSGSMSGMDHGAMAGMNHGAMNHGGMAMDHSQHAAAA
ncbi:copper resistance system multicopper oxidase, partial [Morganella morganii]